MQQETENKRDQDSYPESYHLARKGNNSVVGLDSQRITLGKYIKPGFKKSMYGKNKKFLTLSQLQLW